MANASLALGDTRSAELQLASLPDDPERKNNYDFLVAQGNVYRQRGEDDRALASFVPPTNWIRRTQRSAPRKSNWPKKKAVPSPIASAWAPAHARKCGV
jgi:hypothetical protein